MELSRIFANTQYFHETQRCQWACGEKNILLNLTFRKHVQNVRFDIVCFGMVVQTFREILMLPSLVHYPEDVDSWFSEVEADPKTSGNILLSYKLILLLPSLLVEYGNLFERQVRGAKYIFPYPRGSETVEKDMFEMSEGIGAENVS